MNIPTLLFIGKINSGMVSPNTKNFQLLSYCFYGFPNFIISDSEFHSVLTVCIVVSF